jgi:hypothetical protein
MGKPESKRDLIHEIRKRTGLATDEQAAYVAWLLRQANEGRKDVMAWNAKFLELGACSFVRDDKTGVNAITIKRADGSTFEVSGTDLDEMYRMAEARLVGAND